MKILLASSLYVAFEATNSDITKYDIQQRGSIRYCQSGPHNTMIIELFPKREQEIVNLIYEVCPSEPRFRFVVDDRKDCIKTIDHIARFFKKSAKAYHAQ